MKSIKLILCFFAAGLLSHSAMACSCERNIYFCNELHGPDPVVAFKGVVIDTVTYNYYNQAVYIKIIKKYRNSFGLTDTVKLYGAPHEASCIFDVMNAFKIGDTVRVLTTLNYKPEEDFAPDENYYENYLSLCHTRVLLQEGDLVKGRLFETASGSRFTEYPLSKIEEALENCSFDLWTLRKYQYTQNNFALYPNPVNGHTFQITSKFQTYRFDRVNLYALNGALVRKYTDEPLMYSEGKLDISGIPKGVYLVEIWCWEQRIIKKLVIQ